MAARKTRKKTSFVPRIVFATAMAGAGVIPICATACGGKVVDSGPPVATATVAAVGFDGSSPQSGETGLRGVADSAFVGVADVGFTVADVGFTVADSAFFVADVGFTVAANGFDAEPDGFFFDAETGPHDAGQG